MKYLLCFIICPILILSGCIGDDIIFDSVEETLRIENVVDTLAIGDSHQLEARFTNNIGEIEQPPIDWSTSNPEIISIASDGTITGVARGNAQIYAEVALPENRLIRDTLNITVADQTTFADEITRRQGIIQTTTFYVLEGDFEITQENGFVDIEFDENYEASSSLPGLYIYMTNNPNTINGAYEIGEVTVFSGAHSYRVEGVDLNDYDYLLYYCKPFSVKVGDGKIE